MLPPLFSSPPVHPPIHPPPPCPPPAPPHPQAFDDCTTIGTTFKLLDSFEGLLDREVIAHDLEKKHTDLLASYARDLKVGAGASRGRIDHATAPHGG